MHFLSGIYSFERQKFWFVHEKTKQAELVFAHTGVLKARFICSANHWTNSKLAIVSQVTMPCETQTITLLSLLTSNHHHHYQHYVSCYEHEMYHLCQYEYYISSPSCKHNSMHTIKLASCHFHTQKRMSLLVSQQTTQLIDNEAQLLVGSVYRQTEQEAQLSPSDCAMRLVSSNLANYHATVQKLLIRQVLTKPTV